jgi:hypothetical protein
MGKRKVTILEPAVELRATFRRKYVVSYLDNADEIIICEIALQKLLK